MQDENKDIFQGLQTIIKCVYMKHRKSLYEVIQ